MAQKPDIEGLKDRLNDNSSDDSDSSVDEEVQNAPSLNLRPESVVYFDEIVDFGFAGDVTDEQNIAGDTSGYGGSIAITVQNPSIGGGNLYQSTDPTQSAEYKLFGDYRVEPKYNSDGEVDGISYGSGTTFTGEMVDDFEDDLVTLYLSGGMGTYVGRVLDAYGGPDASVGGLVEFAPDGADEKAAIRRRPVLRDDMRERGGAIMARFPDDASLDGDAVAFLGTVFANGDDYDELAPIRDPEHEGYTSEVDDAFTADLHWEKDEGPSQNATTENSTKDLDLSLDADGETSYDDLSDEWQAFVDQVGAQDVSVDDLDVGALAEGFASDNGLDMETDADTLEDIIRDEE